MPMPPATRKMTNQVKPPSPAMSGAIADSDAGGDEQEAGQDQQVFSAVTVAQAARHERSPEAAHQGTTGRPTFHYGGGQVEVLLVEHLRAADDHPVVAEQEAAQGRPSEIIQT